MRRSMVWSLQALERAATGKVRQADRDATPAVQPRDIYQKEISDALVNAILDYAGSIGVGPSEWLTVAARESVVTRRVVPGDVADTSMTVILRMKGSDLQALRAGTLSRDDARARIDVKHY
jgi:hypothetical protein